MKYAILVAIEEYLDADIESVVQARRHAEAFSKVLELHGFDRADQLVLVNNQATKSVIESKVRKAFQRLRRGDFLYFYYAGRGFSKGAENFITCHDTIDADREGTSVALAPLLRELLATECEQIVLFLDCCAGGVKRTAGSRGIHDNFQVQELEAIFLDAQHGLCLAAGRSDEGSWPRDKRHHGIWAQHVIQAFNGEAPLALIRGLLTANSLQNYLQNEVPRALRNIYPNPENQTPWMFGAASDDFVLADLRDILAARREQASQGVRLVTEMSFLVEETEGLKSLSGWKKGHRIPDRFNDAAEAFAIQCAAEQLQGNLNRVYEKLKDAFGFTRRELEVSAPEGGTGTIITPFFNYSVSATLNPAELDKIVWTRTVDAIKVAAQISSEAFAEVFDDVFDTLDFSLPTRLTIEDFIDAVEAARISDLKIKYDRGATYCELYLPGTVGKVTLRPRSLAIVHDRPKKAQQLIASFDAVWKLIQTHKVPLISGTPR